MPVYNEARVFQLLQEIDRLIQNGYTKGKSFTGIVKEIASSFNQNEMLVTKEDKRTWIASTECSRVKRLVARAIRSQFKEHAWPAFWKFGCVVLDPSKLFRTSHFKSSFENGNLEDTIVRYSECLATGIFEALSSKTNTQSGPEIGLFSMQSSPVSSPGSTMASLSEGSDYIDESVNDEKMPQGSYSKESTRKNPKSKQDEATGNLLQMSLTDVASEVDVDHAPKRRLSTDGIPDSASKRMRYGMGITTNAVSETPDTHSVSQRLFEPSIEVQQMRAESLGSPFGAASSQAKHRSDVVVTESYPEVKKDMDAIMISTQTRQEDPLTSENSHQLFNEPNPELPSWFPFSSAKRNYKLNVRSVGKSFQTAERKFRGLSSHDISHAFRDLRLDAKETFIKFSQVVSEEGPGFVAILTEVLVAYLPEAFSGLIEDETSLVTDLRTKAITTIEMGHTNLNCLLTAIFQAFVLKPVFCSNFGYLLRTVFEFAEAGCKADREEGDHIIADNWEKRCLAYATALLEQEEFSQEVFFPLVNRLAVQFVNALVAAISQVSNQRLELALQDLKPAIFTLMTRYASLQCHMCLGAEKYTFCIPHARQLFNRSTMVTESDGTVGERTSGTVCLALSPIIYASRPIFGEGPVTHEEPRAISKAYVLLF